MTIDDHLHLSIAVFREGKYPWVKVFAHEMKNPALMRGGNSLL